MSTPELSIVMCVYNGVESLEESINSVLSQQGIDFEFIVVDDGSTDGCNQIIHEFRELDDRVRLIEQNNKGLTKALIAGCSQARGKYIARQDVGDVSLTDRFKTQVDILNENPKISMVSSAVTFSAPEGEEFNTIVLNDTDAAEGLKRLDLNTIKGPPHHGSVMFRKDIYELVGGYRKEFAVAQDIDLWTRMIEHGSHLSVQEVLYRAKLHKNSISASLREKQVETAEFIIKCCRARSTTGNDDSIIAELKSRPISRKTYTPSTAKSNSNFYYYLGAGFFKKNRAVSTKYLQYSVLYNPYNWKARLRLIILKWYEKTCF